MTGHTTTLTGRGVGCQNQDDRATRLWALDAGPCFACPLFPSHMPSCAPIMQVARMLRCATPRSLIIIDEFGKVGGSLMCREMNGSLAQDTSCTMPWNGSNTKV